MYLLVGNLFNHLISHCVLQTLSNMCIHINISNSRNIYIHEYDDDIYIYTVIKTSELNI